MEKTAGVQGHRADILVVDDSATSRTWARVVLEQAGYRAQEAESGQEALTKVSAQPPDLILLDVVLPDLDGFEVTRRLRAQSALVPIPIILLTTLGDVDNRVRGLEAGANDFLTKPPDRAELLARVATLLRLKRSQEELLDEKDKIELLYRISRELSGELELEALLARILELTTTSLEASRGSIILLDERGRARRTILSSQEPAPVVKEEAWADILQHGMAGWVARHRQGVVVADTLDDPRWVSIASTYADTRSALVVPLIYEDRTTGVLTLTHEEPGCFTQDHLGLLGSIASQVAVVLRNAQMYDEQRRLADRQTMLYEVLRAVGEQDPEAIAQVAVEAVHRWTCWPAVAIFLPDSRKSCLVARATAGTLPPLAEPSMPVHHGIVGRAYRTAQTQHVPDVAADPDYHVDCPAVRSEMAVPLRRGQRVLGVLNVESDLLAAFGSDDLLLAESLTEAVALALDNAQRATELAILNEIGQALSSALALDELVEMVYDQVSRLFDTDNFYIALYYEESGEWVILFETERGRRLPVQRYTVETGIGGYIIRNRRSVLLRTYQENVAFDQAHGIESLGEQCKCWMGVPLIAADRVIGVMAMQSYEQENLYDERDLALFSTIAAQAAIAIQNARLYTEAEQERGKMAAVLAGTDDAVVVADDDGTTLLFNPAAERIFGVSAAEAIGRPVADVPACRSLAELFSTGTAGLSQSVEIALPEESTFYARVSPVQGVGRVAVAHDITALKELEQMRLQAERSEGERLRRTLECYVGPDLVERVLAEGEGLLERRERVQAVVLFADIRGFTAAAAVLPPEAAVEVLNDFFKALTGPIYRSEGAVIDLIGDELMASFGAPLACPDAAVRAVEAAVALQGEFAPLRERWLARWGITLGLGIGIDRGPAVMGNIGTAERVRFTLVGNTVNRAHRLVEKAGAGEILLAGEVLEAIPAGQCPGGALEEMTIAWEGGPDRVHCLRA